MGKNTGQQESAGWRKSSFSAYHGSCVEVAEGTDAIRVRDSKNPAAGMLTFTRAEWAAFLRTMRG